MEIDKIRGYVDSTRLTEQKNRAKGGAFGQILDKTMDMIQAQQCLKLSPSQANEVVSVEGSEVARVDRQVLRRASNVLDVMEKYAQALNDPKKTLKSIEPIVLQMQEQLRGLKVDSSTHDDGFEKLVNQISVTAGVEAFKFNRGDYIV